jgi:group I intron endonuclease
MVYTLYVAENKLNGKRYVGITGRSILRRWTEHMSHAKLGHNEGVFYKAIRKYGPDGFDVYEADFADSLEDVKKLEIKVISELRPEYNSTCGGGGRLGGIMSEEAKQKIRETHAGNTYRLGKSHTQETRQKLKEAAYKNFHKWKEHAIKGPAASAKKVICLDDEKIYASASEAARFYNVAKSALIELCLGKRHRKTVGGKRFCYEVNYGV